MADRIGSLRPWPGPTGPQGTRSEFGAYEGRALFKVTLTKVATGDTLRLQYVPETLDESIQVQYARLTVPGLSHQPQQFTNTGNRSFGFEAYFNAYDEMSSQFLQDARKFIQGLCYPRESAQDIRDAAPSRVLFVWPGLVSLTCIVTDVSFRHSRFMAHDGASVQYTCRMTLEEIRDVRLYAEDVELFGATTGSLADYPEYLPEELWQPEESE